jgi:FdhD protein
VDHVLSHSLSWDNGITTPRSHRLIAEEPLSIRIQGKPYSVVMRTPGDELAHAAGFCLAEGVVETADDFSSIGFCDEIDGNIVTITLNKSAREKGIQIIERRGFISQTSCGICGKEILEDLFQIVRPMEKTDKLNLTAASHCLESLSNHQPMRDATGASHAAAIYTPNMELIAVAEDVGRHNALDKAIGKLFLENRLREAAFLVLSSRISFELVQKAARARIPIILALSKPTALAVDLAKRLNMTLACQSKTRGITIFCGEKQLDTAN